MAAPEFDHPTRGRAYSHANSELPTVRANEIGAMAQLLDARPGETVLEFGAGNGLLTERILSCVSAPGGRVIAVDNSQYVCQTLRERFALLDVRLLTADDRLPVDDNSCDAVASLANFHHVVDKQAMFREFARVLKRGGRLVMADVAQGTPVQAYFDEVVDKICSTGHKHAFIDEGGFRALCKGAALLPVSWELREVQWVFEANAQRSAEEMAGWFLHRIHDAQCGAAECFDYAAQSLGFARHGAALWMNWQLALTTARRPRAPGQ